ncbi:hypothetical protein K437DRAFT_270346 [Tilletiaria anomala UBC 951]|uniref:Diphthine--ammonia ligase n=1 Tax=Tilletiaria anomala (strain ATCC 24038 / CBS 436.72 / UBC 951) TaxID=1037660 RepID=A0A066VKZ0_TILAU|nr:uncharacterized protein K437DRAFT_270346 [Tilletiaria anomala UBC 951]KDN39245.1 hypothetical protein K437DRAFT_270346 [Tilletiaria anomala UBC 951]
MKVVGLLSGGKDSCYNLCHCVKNGHEIVALATLAPPQGTDELDSYMYQTVGHDAVHLVAEAMGLPLYRHVITGTAVNQGAQYGSRMPSFSQAKLPSIASNANGKEKEKDETEDLYELLLKVKAQHPDVEAVSVGAILSNYQRVRVEHVALLPDINLVPLTFLWQRNQADLLDEMVRAGIDAVLIKVAGIGLDERDLGKSLAQMRPKLHKLNSLYGAHICGEGGEYETLTLDSPLFKKRIRLQEVETIVHADAAFASVSYLRVKHAQLVEKVPRSLAALEAPDNLDGLSAMLGDSLSKAAAADAVGQVDTRSVHALGNPLPQISLSENGWFAAANVCSNGPCDSLEDEVKGAFANLDSLLKERGCRMEDLVHVNLYLQSQQDFQRVNAVYKQQFGASPPTRACIAFGSAASARVTLEVLGWRGDAQEGEAAARPQDLRRALHVQGRSYWAPANIGPYSQAVVAAQRITIAGQIGLRPADLSLPPDADMQLLLSLQHARLILHAVLEQRAILAPGAHWVEGGICWLDEGADGLHLDQKANALWQSQVAIDEVTDRVQEMPVHQRWHLEWLGSKAHTQGVAPPIAYVTLPPGSLPRGASVEWQLTAHTGEATAAADDDAEENAEPEYRRLVRVDCIKRDAEMFPSTSSDNATPDWESVCDPQSAAASGIVFFQQNACVDADGAPYASALSIKVLASPSATPQLLERTLASCRMQAGSAVLSVLPVQRIMHPSAEDPSQLHQAAVALLWWS